MNFTDSTDPGDFAKEIKAFNAIYPGIKISFTSQKPQTSVPIFVTEVQAHHSLTADGTKLDIPGAGPLLTQSLVVNNIDWASLGVPSTEIAQPDGISTPRTERLTLGLSYNTTKLKASDLPNTWQDLINSKWAKQIIDGFLPVEDGLHWCRRFSSGIDLHRFAGYLPCDHLIARDMRNHIGVVQQLQRLLIASRVMQ